MIRVRIVLLIGAWAALFSACNEVTYPVAQPQNVAALSEVPVALRGWYRDANADQKNPSDTIIVESWGYRVKDKELRDMLGQYRLGDLLVLKYYKGYYFANFKVEDQWVLRVLKRDDDNQLHIYHVAMDSEADQRAMKKKLAKKFAVKTIHRNGDLFFQINPSPSQLMAMISDGWFEEESLQRVK